MSILKSRSLKRSRSGATSGQRIQMLAMVFTFLLASVTAWSPSHKPFVSARRNRPSHPQPHTQTPTTGETLTSQKMLKSSATPRVSNRSKESKVKLSQSVLASCDTLPSFPTAHGLLSPETVMQLQEFEHTDGAVANFLSTYRRHGPLSCVSMLGDPAILPHLTHAMRQIAA